MSIFSKIRSFFRGVVYNPRKWEWYDDARPQFYQQGGVCLRVERLTVLYPTDLRERICTFLILKNGHVVERYQLGGVSANSYRDRIRELRDLHEVTSVQIIRKGEHFSNGSDSPNGGAEEPKTTLSRYLMSKSEFLRLYLHQGGRLGVPTSNFDQYGEWTLTLRFIRDGYYICHVRVGSDFKYLLNYAVRYGYTDQIRIMGLRTYKEIDRTPEAITMFILTLEDSSGETL